MIPYILIANFAMSFMVVPALVYIIKIEHRLTRLETKLEMVCTVTNCETRDKDN
jgi:hypothetical protein